MEIYLLDGTTWPEWQDFVSTQQDCWLYHDAHWKQIVEQAYGHRCFYLLAKDSDGVAGILPLMEVRSRLFGSSLTSLPFLESSGLVAKNQDVVNALLDHAIQLAIERRVNYVELRQVGKIGTALDLDLRKTTYVLELQSNETDQWNALCSERRNRIRKAHKSGLEVEFDGNTALPEFYKIWTRNMRDLGSPPHSFSFFEKVVENFPMSTVLALVKHKQEYIGAAICLIAKNKMAIPWVSSSRKHFNLCPNDLLYWNAILHAIGKNCQYFDFGRSTIDSGTAIFKSRWGADPHQLFWYSKITKSTGRKIQAVESPICRLGSYFWQWLPVTLTRYVGPTLRKNMTE